MQSREQKSPQEKYAELETIRKKFEGASDAEGKGIDPEIKDTVVALNALRICTEQSCAGHIEESGTVAPWVDIGAPNQPEFRHEGQKEIFESYAHKLNMTLEDFERGYPHRDEWLAAMDEAEKNPETKEYSKWRKQSGELQKRVSSLLAEFYQNRKVSDNLRLVIQEDKEGSFRVHNGGPTYDKLTAIEDKTTQREALSRQQLAYRQEMSDFAKFLEKKFLNTRSE